MIRPALGATLAVLVLALPSPAAASGDDAAPEARAAAVEQVKVQLQRTLRTRSGTYAFSGRRVRVLGRVTPYVEGETVDVRFIRRGKVVRTVSVPLRPSRRAGQGVFSAEATVRRTGRLAVRATHAPTAGLSAFRSSARRVEVVPRLRYRSTGTVVSELQQGLARLGYTVQSTGRFDTPTSHAVRTWRRIARVGRGFDATPAVVSGVLRGKGAFRARFPQHGRHLEADLSRGVLALLEGSRIVKLVATSPGTEKTPTITGSYTFGRKEPGLNNVEMLHANYFKGGYAVHGYSYVPDFPSSHGCLRIPNADAAMVDRFIRIGDRIDIYP